MTGKLRLNPFSLKDTLECGQFFRFTKALNTYLIQTSDRIFQVRQKGDVLFYEGVEESFLIRFFRLDEDMELKGSYSAFLHTRLNRADKVIFPYKKDLRKK
ncbi:MAG: DNA glycosylase, partial [Deltaproteobacteria bacterium]|nr:DNA glycosylase [Deltaproteobacteria bacterium]